MPERVTAFAPGRVNLIGEHTDYNEGLALPFAIREGVTVQAARSGDERVTVVAHDLDAHDSFDLRRPRRGRRLARVRARRGRGAGAERASRSAGARLQIRGSVPSGSGLSSSAALEVALCLALLAVSDAAEPDRLELARICSRIENDWVGARTGLLDQIASLFGEPDRALEIDFRSLEVRPVTLRLAGYSLVTLDSGERHANAGVGRRRGEGEEPGYNQRRDECQRACELLSLSESARRDAGDGASDLPHPLRDRVRHVISENERVRETVDRAGRRAICPASVSCSTRPTRACATALRSPLPRSRRRYSGCATRARSAPGSSAAASAVMCWGCSARTRHPPAGAVAVAPGAGRAPALSAASTAPAARTALSANMPPRVRPPWGGAPERSRSMDVEDDAEAIVRPRRAAVMADVGRLAGVSHQTVSRVINGSRHVSPATRERVLAAMRELGYRPNSIARALVTGRSRTLGVVSFDTTLYGPASTLFGIERAAHQAGYFIIIASQRALDRASVVEAVDRLRLQGVEGIMVIVSEQAAAEALLELHIDVPMVAVEAGPERGVPVVAVDQRLGATMATRHLLDLGHATVHHVTGPPESLEAQQRTEGWRTTLEAAGAPIPAPLIGDWSARAGYHVGGRLARDDSVTAVFVGNDQMALGLLRAMHEAGRRDPGRGQRRRLRRHPGGDVFHAAADDRASGFRRGRQPQSARAGGGDPESSTAAGRTRPARSSRPSSWSGPAPRPAGAAGRQVPPRIDTTPM